jgi:acyl-CoA reductase-like NAD-dependent aldehyde dehydrogenase
MTALEQPELDAGHASEPAVALAGGSGALDDTGARTEPVRDGPFPLRSPVDGAEMPAVAATSPEHVAGVVERARAAQKAWAELAVRDRAAVVAKVKKRLLARAEEIAELVRKECGKPVEEAALAEVLPNADLIDYWTFSIEDLLEPTQVDLDALSYPGKTGRIQRAARGVVALIAPWNYPVAIPLRTLVPALLAGNAVVFKPSEITPRSGALVASLFEGLLPQDVLTVVQGGADVGQALVDADVDLVVFTGSVATGRRVAIRCAERLIPCSLELGGKDAAIVLKDAHVERTARGLVWGAFTNAGQNCAAIERAYVERAIADKLIERIVALTKELVPGVDTAVMTTEAQCDKVRRHLEQAIAGGAELLAGGAPAPGSNAFVPTVVKVANEDIALMREETFGPILPIVIVDDVDDAVARVNASRYGLTTSVWTRRTSYAQELATRLPGGIVTINNHAFTGAIAQAPWTGTGDSGWGVTNSPHALAELTRPRFILVDRSSAKRELWWYPYTPVLRKLVFAMARARGGAGLFGRLAAIFDLLTAIPRRLFGR